MTRAALLAVAGLLACGLLSCAQKAAPRSAARSAAPMPAPSPHEVAHDDIRQYWSEIRTWRVEQGWAPEPSASRPLNGALPARMCSGDCGDICNVADAICQNKDRICEIAKQLPGDSWAEDKCASARRSCDEAREACQCCRKTQRESTGDLSPVPSESPEPQPCSP